MKYLALLLGLALGFGGTALAQVSVEVVMDQDQFIANEAIPVKVRIVNNSGQTLRFGSEDWLNFSVEGTDGFIVIKNKNAPEAHGFQVKASEVATARADLAPCFDITKPGRYAVSATVKIKDWEAEATSAKAFFYIIRGVKLWEQEFGVPQEPGDHAQPEVRKYVLQRAAFAKRTELFLRLTDSDEKTLRLLTVGPMISFSDPQTLMDSMSSLHLFYQEGSHVYNYSVINANGDVTARQTYFYGGSAPRMETDNKGRIKIIGGIRHLADNDIPTSRKSETNEIPAPLH